MAKIALRIGQAFSDGMKSAPAQVRDLQNLLYSLSVALSAVGAAHEAKPAMNIEPLDRAGLPVRAPPQFTNGQNVLLGILQSCRETLDHLEVILDRYGEVSDVKDKSHVSSKKWAEGLKANWKKIKWTTEKGDLAELKSTLTVYTNSLNLILAVFTNNQADQLRNDLGEVSSMLLDIHSWFVRNLRNPSKVAVSSPASNIPAGSEEPPALRFELCQQSGEQVRIVCPAATPSGDLLEIEQGSLSRDIKLFSCICSDGSHRAVVESYRMSYTSFTAQIASGERSWLVNDVSSELNNKLSLLVIRKVPLNAICDFEELLLRSFDLFQAKHMFQSALIAGLVRKSDIDKHGSRANIVDIVGNVQNRYRSIKAVAFVLETAQLRKSNVDSVQIFHYKSIGLRKLDDGSILAPNSFRAHKDAEVLIHFGSSPDIEPGGPTHSILKLKWNSEIYRNQDRDTVSIKDIECTAYMEEEMPTSTIHATVVFELPSPADAGSLHSALEAIQLELLVIHLQDPWTSEVPLLQIQAKDVQINQFLIRDADIMILRNISTAQCRLLIRSRQGHTIVSQELKREFFDVLMSTGQPDYGAPTYEISIDDSGRRSVKQYSKGFRYLIFCTSQTDQVYRLGLAAIQTSEKLNLAIRAKD